MRNQQKHPHHVGILIFLAASSLGGCDVMESPDPVDAPLTFSEHVAFLEQYVDTIVLQQGDARVVVVPEWQGRVMDSTAMGSDGPGYGWSNRNVIETGIRPVEQRTGLQRHIHVFGGEDRFWIGPEGGQFSWFFAPGAPFAFDNWKVPDFIDTLPWPVVERSSRRVAFEFGARLGNWSGNEFDLRVHREIVLLDREELEQALDIPVGERIAAVAYESRNTVTNAGQRAWTQDTGMPSIWILGMFPPGDRTRVVIPFRQGDALGPVVKSDYFGEVPDSRLEDDLQAGAIYFVADGDYRSKIGISQQRSLGVAGSWDAARGVLTIVQYNAPAAEMPYVNSSWEFQTLPFEGDAINSYNDGPVDGGVLGPFYEIETSSPALPLAPGEDYRHVHRTIHMEGDSEDLDRIARRILGVGLADIEGRQDR